MTSRTGFTLNIAPLLVFRRNIACEPYISCCRASYCALFKSTVLYSYVFTAHVSGAPFPWRDSQKPRQILEGLAARYGWGKVEIEPVLDQNGEASDWQLALLGRTYSLAALDEAARTARRTEARARVKLERQKLQKEYEAEGLGFINLGASNSHLDAIAISSDADETATFAEPDEELLGAPDERLALQVMRDPSFPLELVTEHVETRPLYSALQEGIEQVCNGELRSLWATKCILRDLVLNSSL